ncbi:hypothetical protein PC39_11944 [Salinisphaera sp. PC39]|uniref:energy transducer TonB n=1 Tax=Salinisphaera sp. PC39 TaxID=1304156 RepID=UPI00333FE198
MRSIARLFTGLPAAFLVTALLFLILAALIHQDEEVRLSEDRSVEINVTRQLQDSTTREQAEFQRPVLDQPPPPPPAVNDPSFRPKVSGQIGELPDFSQADLDIGTGFNPDRDAQPMVRIPPQYPGRCQSRAAPVERVVVEFDVSPEGQVVNARAIDSTNSCFDRAAIRAVERWKYEPKFENNRPQPRYGVRTSFKFKKAE